MNSVVDELNISQAFFGRPWPNSVILRYWFQAVVSNGRSSQVAALVATGCQLRGRGWNSTLKLAVALRSSPGQTSWTSPSSLPFRTDSSLTSTENQRKINQGQFVHWQFHSPILLGQAKFLGDSVLRLHHWVWPKTCAHTIFWVPRTSFSIVLANIDVLKITCFEAIGLS